MSGFVVGTAGHIDHGKTALVKALTGVDTDRLKEEKERGITIELGFAHLNLPGRGRVGVVDVPGHERFVRTMVAGAVGVDLVVLVVAADEGVMPQTREHLDICALLGVSRGVVALSKADLVDEELRALAMAELGEALQGSFLEGAPIIACSSETGEGLTALCAAIAAGLGEVAPRDASGVPRLPIDRVFSMKGFGTVVTGTLWSGRLRVGDEVAALPGLATGKIRGLQVHGGTVDEAMAGQRTALNLAVALQDLERGQMLAPTGVLEAGRLVDVSLRCLPSCHAALRRRARVLLHAGTAQSLATVTLLDRGALEPGDAGFAQLQLETPMVLLPGDRFILRGFQVQKNHGTTLGGGTVLRTLGPRHRRGTPELLEELRANDKAPQDERVRLEIARAGRSGTDRAELQKRVACGPAQLEGSIQRLLSGRRVIRFDRERSALISEEAHARLREEVRLAVAAHHGLAATAPGMPREELRSKVTGDARLFHSVVEALVGAGELVVERDLVRLPDHDPQQAASRLAPLVERVLETFRAAGLTPPRPAEAALVLASRVEEVERALLLLVRSGELVKVKDLHFARPAVDQLRSRLSAYLREKGQINAQEWKELSGVSRKFAIPLAEHFDGEKLTLRVGEIRRLRGA